MALVWQGLRSAEKSCFFTALGLGFCVPVLVMASKWVTFADYDSCPGEDAAKHRTSDFENCKKLCELYNYSGFVHKRGEVFFRKVPADMLFNQKMQSRGSTLFVKLPQAAGVATAIPIPTATAAPVRPTPAYAMPYSPGPQYAASPTYGQQPQGAGMYSPHPQYGPQPQYGAQMRQVPSTSPVSQPVQQGQPVQQAQTPVSPGQRPNHMVMPPASFPELNNCHEEELTVMLQNGQLLEDWIICLPKVKALEESVREYREDQSNLAEQILHREVDFVELRTQCEAGLGGMNERLTTLQSLQEQRSEILMKRAPGEMAEQLGFAAQEADDKAEDSLNDALNSPDNLDVAALRALRTAYVTEKQSKHARFAMAARLAMDTKS